MRVACAPGSAPGSATPRYNHEPHVARLNRVNLEVAHKTRDLLAPQRIGLLSPCETRSPLGGAVATLPAARHTLHEGVMIKFPKRFFNALSKVARAVQPADSARPRISPSAKSPPSKNQRAARRIRTSSSKTMSLR